MQWLWLGAVRAGQVAQFTTNSRESTEQQQQDYYKLAYAITEGSINAGDALRGIAFWRWNYTSTEVEPTDPQEQASVSACPLCLHALHILYITSCQDVLSLRPCLRSCLAWPAKLVSRKLCFGAFEPSAVAPNLNPGTPAGFLPEHYGQQASGAHARCVLICPVASTHSITRQLCCAELHVCAATRGPVFTQTIGPFSQRVSGRCPTNSGAGGTTATSTAGRRLLQVCAEFVNVICYGPALSWVYCMLRGCFVITLSG